MAQSATDFLAFFRNTLSMVVVWHRKHQDPLHEQGRHSRRVTTASGWPWCTRAEAPVNFGSTMTVTGVDMNSDGIPRVLQQPQVGHGAPVLKRR